MPAQIPEPMAQQPAQVSEAAAGGRAVSPAPTPDAWQIKADWQPFQAAQLQQALGRGQQQPPPPAANTAWQLPSLPGAPHSPWP
jgi:hypothetical protein